MIKLMLAGAALVAAAANAQTPAEPAAAQSTANKTNKDPANIVGAEARAGQAPMGEADAQRSATAQSPVDPVTPNEQVSKDEAEKACEAKKADGSLGPCPAPKSAQPTSPPGATP